MIFAVKLAPTVLENVETFHGFYEIPGPFHLHRNG